MKAHQKIHIPKNLEIRKILKILKKVKLKMKIQIQKLNNKSLRDKEIKEIPKALEKSQVKHYKVI